MISTIWDKIKFKTRSSKNFIFNVKNHLGEMLGSLLGLFRMLVGGGGTMILPPELCYWKMKGELFM